MTVSENFTIADVLWYKIGGKVKYFLTCENREDIVQAIEFIKEHKPKKIFICGMGSNLIFPDDFFDGVVIQIVTPSSQSTDVMHVIGEDILEVFSGVILDSAIQYGFVHHLIGLAWAGGLPGTVGAGVRGNVGAYGGEIKDSLISAEVIDYSGETPVLKTLTNKALDFVYRGSYIKSHKKMVVVSAQFQLQKCDDETLEKAKKEYDTHREHRAKNHPLEYPNCGSVFKNLRDPEQIKKVLEIYPDLKENVENKWFGKVAVASVIERLGLKGYRVGNAQVSQKHALFIVNLGGATAADVLAVITKIQETFQKTFGFSLEIEVEILK